MGTVLQVKPLLRWKLLVFRRWLEVPTRRTAFEVSAFLTLIVVLLLYGFSRRMFTPLVVAGRLTGVAGGMPGPDTAVLAFVYLAGMIVCLPVALTTGFSCLYGSSDLGLLFKLPISSREVFVVKLVEAAVPTAGLALLLVFPMVAGYGAAAAAPAYFYVLAVGLCLLTALLPLAVGMLLSLAAIRLIPPYRVRELGVALSSLLGISVHLVTRLLAWHVGSGAGFASLGEYGAAAGDLVPSLWLARATAAAARGSGPPLLAWAGLGAAAAAFLLTASLVLVEAAFLSGWTGAREAVRGKARSRRRRTPARRAPLAALALKECRMVLREPREWYQMAYLGAVVVLSLFGYGRPTGQPAILGPALLLVFGGGVVFILTLGTISRDGRCWWVTRAAPLRGAEIVLGKIAGAQALVAVPGTLLVLGLAWLQGAKGWQLLSYAGMFLAASPGLVSICVYADCVAPDFRDTGQPRNFSLERGLVALLLGLIFAGMLALGYRLFRMGAWVGSGLVPRLAGLVLLPATIAAALALAVFEGGRCLENMSWPEEGEVSGTR